MSLQDLEMNIMYAIQHLRCGFLDSLMVGLTTIVGSYGYLWVAVGALMCFFKKTRKAGAAVLISYAFVYLGGNLLLKDWIARPRPCHIDETIELLVKRPSSFSCPSTHTAWSFGAATAIAMELKKKWGIPVCVLAAVIGFSRLYLFVHFPTDVLFGVALGIAFGIAAAYIVRFVSGKWDARHELRAEAHEE